MIVVTGGAGFIGSNFIAGLEEAGGDPVTVVDWLGHEDKWKNLRRRDLDELVDPGALDDFLARRVDDITYVVHMGAISSTTETDGDVIAETNLRLSQHLWRWCARHEVPLLYASSAATYGDGSAGFDDDASPGALARLVPLNAYGWSKLAFDKWVAHQAASAGAKPPQWVGLRFFNVYGPNEYHKEDMRSVVTKAYPAAAAGKPMTLFRSHHPDYPDGGQKRDFVYVKDCVDVMLWLTEHREVSGLFNLGTGRAQTWLELMGALYGAVGRELDVSWVDTPVEIRDRYQYFTQAEMERLRAAGYRRSFRSVEEGVADYVEHHLATDDPYR
ncbi:MAG: ADP-glyceromanno-heptose 6-epimerase [Gemmatimonadetes bacterium]|nr:ADP-glyceromanno-heptose 6-epimerase [Gemmatimonadota bacterium]